MQRLLSSAETIDVFGTVVALRKWRPGLVQVPVRFRERRTMLHKKKNNYSFLPALEATEIPVQICPVLHGKRGTYNR